MSKPKIVICLGSSCFARGNAKNVEVTEKFLESNGLKDDIDVELSGALCRGRCADGPIVSVDEHIYTEVDSGLMLDILKQTFHK